METRSQPSLPAPTLPVADLQPPRATPLARAAALLAGVVLLAGGILVSFGLVLFAPLGMAVAAYVRRRRGRPLRRVGHWIAGMVSVAVVLALIGGIAAAIVPASTWQDIMHASDSAAAQSRNAPPPAWLERIAPGSTRRAAQKPQLPQSFEAATMSIGAAIAIILFAGVFGSLGWSAGMLLGFAGRGRWPGATHALAPDEFV